MRTAGTISISLPRTACQHLGAEFDLGPAAFSPKVPFSRKVRHEDRSMKVESNEIRLSFAHADGGLKSRDGKPLTEVEIAGADGMFVAADLAAWSVLRRSSSGRPTRRLGDGSSTPPPTTCAGAAPSGSSTWACRPRPCWSSCGTRTSPPPGSSTGQAGHPGGGCQDPPEAGRGREGRGVGPWPGATRPAQRSGTDSET